MQMNWFVIVAVVVMGTCPGPIGWAQSDAAVIRPTGEVEQIGDGFGFVEGPAAASDGTLYFTDIPNNRIMVRTAAGELKVFVEPSGHANGLLIDDQDRLLACQMDGRLVAYDRKTKGLTVLAEGYEGKRFNACNDLTVDADGGIYFTDPLFRAPQPLPQGIQAVYYRAADGTVRRVTGDLPAPNGIHVSADGKSLYVIPSRSAEMLRYPIERPGKLGEREVFCTLKQPAGQSNSGGDGMALDVEGNLYITSNLGVQVFSPEGGYRGLVKFPEQPANGTFGGPEGKTMYVTARTGVYAVAMPIAGR